MSFPLRVKLLKEDEHSARMKREAEQGREQLLFRPRIVQSKPKSPTKKNRALFHPQTTAQQIVQAFGNNSCIPFYINRIRVSSFQWLLFIFLLLGTDGQLEDASLTIIEGKDEKETQLPCLQSKMKGTYISIITTIIVYLNSCFQLPFS